MINVHKLSTTKLSKINEYVNLLFQDYLSLKSYLIKEFYTVFLDI